MTTIIENWDNIGFQSAYYQVCCLNASEYSPQYLEIYIRTIAN